MLKRVPIAIAMTVALSACGGPVETGAEQGAADAAATAVESTVDNAAGALEQGADALEQGADAVATTAEEVLDPAAAEAAWQPIEVNWDQAMGSVKERWVELTDDDLMALSGDKSQLVGLIEQKYGLPREIAEAEVNEWAASF